MSAGGRGQAQVHPALDDTADICPKDVQLPVFSMREIRKHNKRGDAWVVVSNLILDVGEFAKAHPGGEDILLTVAGKDATAIFRSFKHSDSAKNSLAKLAIGFLDPDDYLVDEDVRAMEEAEKILKEPNHSEATYEAIRRILNHFRPTWLNLNLGNLELGDDGAIAVARVLSHSPAMIRKVMMEGNGIGPRGATAIADMLAVNNDMTVLVLQCNNVGDKGAAALAEALRVNRSLQVLGLPINLITSAGASRLGAMLGKNKVLRVLSLKHNAIRDVAEIASGLASNRHLEGLNLSFNAIDDKGAAALAASLASNAKLRHLWLSGNPITGDGAEALNRTLSSNRTIEQIRLTISNDMYREMLSGHTGQGFKLLGAQPHRTSIHFKAGVPYVPAPDSPDESRLGRREALPLLELVEEPLSGESNGTFFRSSSNFNAPAGSGSNAGADGVVVEEGSGGANGRSLEEDVAMRLSISREEANRVTNAVDMRFAARGASLDIPRAGRFDRRMTIDIGGAPPPPVN